MTDPELMVELQNNSEFNPWLDVAEEWLRDVNAGKTRDNFIHPKDEAAVERHTEAVRKWCEKKNKKVKNGSPELLAEDFELHGEIMPQPFIGNPQASIWLLLENPGYCAADVYDLKSIEEGRSQLAKEKVSLGRIICHQGQSEEELLMARQSSVLNQLMFKFDNDSAFYELRPEFNTIEPQKDKTLGGYNWYTKYLCCKTGYFRGCSDFLKALSHNIFLIEYIPYHSIRFNDFDIEFAHHKMWQKMVRHAIKEKIIVVRNSSILEHVKDTVDKEALLLAEFERRIILIEGKSASFSVKNTSWPCSASSLINPIIRQINRGYFK